MHLPIAAKNINKTDGKKKVLVAPLDWGLGHATRCVPVISSLLDQGFEVILAADSVIALLLRKEFPRLTILPLRGYNIRYSRNKQRFLLKMFLQVPKVLAAIREERRWLKTVIAEHAIDIVLSDNRFGLHHKTAYCIFMTHQLFIKTGNRFTEKIAQKINYRYINRFNECWVPDTPGPGDLAGELSHPKILPRIPVKYIGALSRFIKGASAEKTGILIILSGPEPQRSLLENILMAEVIGIREKITLVRGLPGPVSEIEAPTDNITIIDHLPAEALNELILSAKTVISRSGYSTIMDLAVLQQPAILIPTPGQAEQEYLGEYLSEKKYCIVRNQEEFDLEEAIRALQEKLLMPFPLNTGNLLPEAVKALR